MQDIVPSTLYAILLNPQGSFIFDITSSILRTNLDSEKLGNSHMTLLVNQKSCAQHSPATLGKIFCVLDCHLLICKIQMSCLLSLLCTCETHVALKALQL